MPNLIFPGFFLSRGRVVGGERPSPRGTHHPRPAPTSMLVIFLVFIFVYSKPVERPVERREGEADQVLAVVDGGQERVAGPRDVEGGVVALLEDEAVPEVGGVAVSADNHPCVVDPVDLGAD